jgi:rhodanese-related sulfurtransferase
MRLLILALVVSLGAALTSLAQPSGTAEASRMTLDEFKKLHAEGRLLVVDVRTADAYLAGHIPGARSMPLASLADPAVVASLKGTTKPIVTYCA